MCVELAVLAGTIIRTKRHERSCAAFECIRVFRPFAMVLRQPILMLIAIACVVSSGCCWRQPAKRKCCPPFASPRTPLAVSTKSENVGVSSSFKAIEEYAQAKVSLVSQIAADGTLAIELDEVIHLASQNSALGNAIDHERHLLGCQTGDCCQRTALDRILAGEADEQRIKSAAEAAEAFLGLVQVALQSELLDESREKLADFQETVVAADEAGFATASSKHQLTEVQLELHRLESKLSTVQQQLTYTLNELINEPDAQLVIFQPVYDLSCERPDFDVNSELATAENNRPGIQSAESALASGVGAEYWLSQLDQRLGVKLANQPLRKRFLRQQIIENIRVAELPDNSSHGRRQQAQEMLAVRKRQARAEAAAAMLEVQSNYESLTIANENVQALMDRAEQLVASKQVDAKQAYVDKAKNLASLQEARSERVAAAIACEIGRVKLRAAQGTLGR